MNRVPVRTMGIVKICFVLSSAVLTADYHWLYQKIEMVIAVRREPEPCCERFPQSSDRIQ